MFAAVTRVEATLDQACTPQGLGFGGGPQCVVFPVILPLRFPVEHIPEFQLCDPAGE